MRESKWKRGKKLLLSLFLLRENWARGCCVPCPVSLKKSVPEVGAEGTESPTMPELEDHAFPSVSHQKSMKWRQTRRHGVVRLRSICFSMVTSSQQQLSFCKERSSSHHARAVRKLCCAKCYGCAAAFWRSLTHSQAAYSPVPDNPAVILPACLIIFHHGHARIIALFSVVWLLVVIYE